MDFLSNNSTAFFVSDGKNICRITKECVSENWLQQITHLQASSLGFQNMTSTKQIYDENMALLCATIRKNDMTIAY